MNYANLFKPRDTTNEQLPQLERAINSAFELMKQKGVSKVPVVLKSINDNGYANEIDNPQIINSRKLNGGDIYYSLENYAKDEVAFFIANQSYKVINLVTGELGKEKSNLHHDTIQLPADMREGIEVSSRYFHNGNVKTKNPNLNFNTKTEFYERNRKYVREFAEFIMESGMTADEFKTKVKEIINK
jgi:hypothetical protein